MFFGFFRGDQCPLLGAFKREIYLASQFLLSFGASSYVFLFSNFSIFNSASFELYSVTPNHHQEAQKGGARDQRSSLVGLGFVPELFGIRPVVAGLDISMFDRLLSMGMEASYQRISTYFNHCQLSADFTQVQFLSEQYRMHPQIASFPSWRFYRGELKSVAQPVNLAAGKKASRCINKIQKCIRTILAQYCTLNYKSESVDLTHAHLISSPIFARFVPMSAQAVSESQRQLPQGILVCVLINLDLGPTFRISQRLLGVNNPSQ